MDRNLARFPKESSSGLSRTARYLVRSARSKIDLDKMEYSDIDFSDHKAALYQIEKIRKRKANNTESN